MKLANFPIEPGSPVKFRLTGFPQEEVMKPSLERFYALKPDAHRSFIVMNEFDEPIFSGSVDEHGKVVQLESLPRQKKYYHDIDPK